MNFKKTAIIAVVAGLAGGALLLGGVMLGSTSGKASPKVLGPEQVTPKATATPYIPDDSYLLATMTPTPVEMGNPDASGSLVPVSQQGGGTQDNGGPNPAPQPQPQQPEPAQPKLPAPQPPVVQPEPDPKPPVGVEAPVVIKTTPTDGSAGNTRGTSIQFYFSHVMDKGSVNAAFAMLSPVVNGTISWNAEGTVMTFDPAADFAYGQWVEAKIGATAKDAMGTPLFQDKAIKFRVMRITTVDLYSVGPKDGFVYNPQVAALSHVNTASNRIHIGTWQRGFLNFDLSSLPEDLINITDTELSVYQSAADAQAYGAQTGDLRVESVYYGSLDISDFARPGVQFCWPICAPVSYLLSSGAGLGVKSTDVIAFVKADWEKRAEQGHLSQFRLRFEKENGGDGPDIGVELHSGEGGTRPKLRITYTHP